LRNRLQAGKDGILTSRSVKGLESERVRSCSIPGDGGDEEFNMSRLMSFFKHSDTVWGIFYPKHYVLAAYSRIADAEHAKEALKRAGWSDEDVIAVPGKEVVQFAEDDLMKHGLWGLLMTELSRLLDTEVTYADRDLAAAKKGASFLAVHCPTEDAKNQAWKVLEPTEPIVARYYHLAGIDHLVGDDKP